MTGDGASHDEIEQCTLFPAAGQAVTAVGQANLQMVDVQMVDAT